MTSTEHNQRRYLRAMGFDQWVRRDAVHVPISVSDDQVNASDNLTANMPEISPSIPRALADLPVEVSVNENQQVSQTEVSQILSMDWSSLESQIGQCRGCKLFQRRTQAVPGAGDKQAKWLIIGEAPGEQEDLKGEPFVGRAGVLLNNLLQAIGLKREQVYITNVVKCRPPGNRDPHVDEVAACHAWMQRQIQLISPSIILVLGRIAAQHLLQSSDPVSRMRGEVRHLPSSDIPLIVTYHPAYLLRKPTEKAKVWIDLKFAMSQINSQD